MSVEIAFARRFGTSAPVDAFRIASAVVYMGQQVFVGILPSVIVPLFAEYTTGGTNVAAWKISRELTRLALIPTSIVCIALFLSPGTAVSVLAPGLGPQAREWAIFFVRWFSLSLIPLLCSGAAIGLLYAHHVFWTATAAQLAYNVTLFASVLFFGGTLLGAASITLGVLLATSVFVLLQLLKLMPTIRAADMRQCQDQLTIVRAGVRKAIRLGLPLLGLPVMNQAIAIIAVWSLSSTPVGTIAAMGYAGKLVQMALLLPDTMGTVLFPRFAVIARASDRRELRELATRAVRMASFVSLPIACILFALRLPLIELLFRHGAFSKVAADRVGLLFGLFLMGMPARVLIFYQQKLFYAVQNTRLPTYLSVITMVFAAMVMPKAAERFGAEGIAAIFAFLGWMTALAQAYVLGFKHAAWDSAALTPYALKIFVPAAAAAWVGRTAGTIVVLQPSSTMALMAHVASGAILASLSYWLVAIATEIPEAQEIGRYLRWQSASALNSARALLCGYLAHADCARSSRH